MTRKETTKLLGDLLEQHLNPHNNPRIYTSREVTFDYGRLNQTRVDYMLFKPVNNSVSGIEKGDFYCYEVKSCPADFKSKNGHNFFGDYNYYVMSEATYQKCESLIPFNVGVYITSDEFEKAEYLTLVKKARRTDRKYPLAVMLLMMYRSTNRELKKVG